MKKQVLLIITVVFLWLIAGCAIYSFSPGGKSSIKTIAISQIENKTIEAGLSSRMTDLIVDAFIADGNMKVVSEKDADAVLIGILTNYNREAYTYDESDNVTQYVVKLVFDVTLQKGGSEEEFWKEIFYSEGYYATDIGTEDGSNFQVATSEEEGQVLAANKLVQDVINRTTKSW
jgi:hypothetical protein